MTLDVIELVSKIRVQYHLRRTETGIDAWNVQKLIALGMDLPIKKIDPRKIAELDENHWYFHDSKLVPSPRSVIEHIRLVQDCDLDHPIILDHNGRVMDGMHRICKALLKNAPAVPAVQFTVDPEPDFIDCSPEDLPYDV